MNFLSEDKMFFSQDTYVCVFVKSKNVKIRDVIIGITT